MSSDFSRSRNDDAGDDAEDDLGESEPAPRNSGVERRIHKSEDRMKKASPKERSNDSAKKDRSPWPHRQHGSVEQPDECANCRMDDRCCDQPIQMEGRDVSSCRVCPVRDARASKQINCIPDTVLSEIAVKESREDHHDSPRYSSTKSGGHRIAFNRKERPMNFADLDVCHLGPYA